MIYTNNTFKPKKKKKSLTKAEVECLTEYNLFLKQNGLPPVNSLKAKKYAPKFRELKTKTVFRRPGTQNIKSHETVGLAVCSRVSIMDQRSLEKESKETRDAIVAKSKRIALMYNKGAYQYITDDVDLTTIGTRNRRM
jgi:hypothetical protein